MNCEKVPAVRGFQLLPLLFRFQGVQGKSVNPSPSRFRSPFLVYGMGTEANLSEVPELRGDRGRWEPGSLGDILKGMPLAVQHERLDDLDLIEKAVVIVHRFDAGPIETLDHKGRLDLWLLDHLQS